MPNGSASGPITPHTGGGGGSGGGGLLPGAGPSSAMRSTREDDPVRSAARSPPRRLESGAPRTGTPPAPAVLASRVGWQPPAGSYGAVMGLVAPLKRPDSSRPTELI